MVSNFARNSVAPFQASAVCGGRHSQSRGECCLASDLCHNYMITLTPFWPGRSPATEGRVRGSTVETLGEFLVIHPPAIAVEVLAVQIQVPF